MRRLVAALMVVMVAMALVGCGGGDEEAAAPETPAAGQDAPASPSGGGGDEADEVADDNSPIVEGFPMPFPDDPGVIPKKVQNRLNDGQPMLILYFDDEHEVVNDLDKEIDSVLEGYEGLIDRVEFSIYDDLFTVAEEDMELGENLDPELSQEERDERIAELKKVYKLADELDIGYTPFIILVDREGTIVWMWRGYVDRSTLELEVMHAVQ